MNDVAKIYPHVPTVDNEVLAREKTVGLNVNKTGFIPTADKILIEPVEVEEKHGAIVLPTQALEKEQLAQQCGIVIAIGETASLAPEMAGVEVGAMVLLTRYSGQEYPVDGVKYRIYRARDVIGRALRLPDSVIRGAKTSIEAFGSNEQVA